MTAAVARKYDILLLASLDRLTRDHDESQQIDEKLLSVGIDIQVAG